MKYIILTLFIFISFIGKCQNKPIETNDELKKYYNAGIPTLNKNWSPEEYTSSIKILIDSAENNTLQLPSKQNNTIEILEKISDFNDYWFFQSNEISDQNKFLYSLDMITNVRQLYSTYLKNNNSINGVYTYSYEMCLLNKTLILMMNEILELTDQFLLEHPNLTDIQKEGFQKMKKGLNTFISGNFITIKDEYKSYNEADICAVSKTLFEFYKNNRDRIDEISKNEFDKKIKDIQQNNPLDCVKKSASIIPY